MTECGLEKLKVLFNKILKSINLKDEGGLSNTSPYKLIFKQIKLNININLNF